MNSHEPPSHALLASDPQPNRRTVLWVAGAAAALSGAGAAWWRSSRVPVASELSGEPAPEGFWKAQWPTPAGTQLSMAGMLGRPLLLNFWATWCPPCVEELPLLNAFYRQHHANGWQVVGLAVDKLQPVQQFLQKSPLDFPVGMAGIAGTELGRSLGNLAGGLPFTVVFGADGSILHRKMGRVTAQELALWAGLK
ncbi:MAG: redoxin [Burkholderiales bacterium PBB4]|nr:MAG: redoxin [Burkholderiales bacterium PBB4]